MAEIPTEIIDRIHRFISELERQKIRINRAILFGSYANGTYNDWSDIDLAITSDQFTGNRLTDKSLLRKIKAKIDYSISPLPYKPEDFNESDFFVKKIMEEGISII
ncbi:MAG: nucleotidyltransferase domain-containing protein [Bacteroidetes bacterium]|nr:nucleotidyltransferase domain-containing protein [Bacteroidota bacterium]MBU2508134.1 nucleotidyltransferase domain-containing protein [Bacteroidota bacterium]